MKPNAAFKLRNRAIEWFRGMTLEEQFYKTIEHNDEILGDKTRHPSTLTGREVEAIYRADQL